MLQEQVSETENFHEDSVGAEPIGPTQDAVVQDRSATSVDEASGEPQKHTYASIVCFFSYYGSSVASMMLIFFFWFWLLIPVTCCKRTICTVYCFS